MSYKVLAYYSVEPLENPEVEVKRHQKFLQELDFTGRIYISEQGINGQASGLAAHADQYIAWMKEDPRFKHITFKEHLSDEHAFAKMTVKYRPQLVAIDYPVDFKKAGEYVNPSQWKQMLEEKDEDTILIDVRNDYEWEVGHFEGAELPPFQTFRQFPYYAKELKEKKDPHKTKVMMYCTGGIRCEYYSCVMKEAGFENVYQLEGGVIQYGLDHGSEHWDGKLFVFDDRMVIPLDDASPEPLTKCLYCGIPNDHYYNCANMDCNELFHVCLDCLREHQGCCSSSCQKGRVRPYREDAKPFRKYEKPLPHTT